MKFEKTKVYNFDGALRGMRNPLESWNKSDSKWNNGHRTYHIGENDLKLAQRLILSGNEHSKFMRQIFVSVDITAPLYWWKESDTYKIGTVANSTSTMHKLATTPIALDCFETDDYNGNIDCGKNEEGNEIIGIEFEEVFMSKLEYLRLKYLETNDKRYWKELIRWLPESWLQTRTVTMNYANLRNMYFQRNSHKLTEWSVSFVNWINTLPYAKELIMINKQEGDTH